VTQPPSRPAQRSGHIGDDDNQFCGSSVFGELRSKTHQVTDLVALAFGLSDLTNDDREILRCIALSTCSPDARVWPLKLSRVLASYGNPYSGFYGAQIGSYSDRMGPGTTSMATQSMVWVQNLVNKGESIDSAVETHLRERGKISGFGVPFRKEDERLLALYEMLKDHPARSRPYWKLHLEIAISVRARLKLEPNIVLPMAALLLDLGLKPTRAGFFVSTLMTPSFAANAVEASENDGALLKELPWGSIDYRGKAARELPQS
jgi:hypothetical protein